jgi:hypothetical protein
VFPLLIAAVFVSPDEEVFEEVAKELESNILESKGRTVKELEEVYLFFFLECD